MDIDEKDELELLLILLIRLRWLIQRRMKRLESRGRWERDKRQRSKLLDSVGKIRESMLFTWNRKARFPNRQRQFSSISKTRASDRKKLSQIRIKIRESHRPGGNARLPFNSGKHKRVSEYHPFFTLRLQRS